MLFGYGNGLPHYQNPAGFLGCKRFIFEAIATLKGILSRTFNLPYLFLSDSFSFCLHESLNRPA